MKILNLVYPEKSDIKYKISKFPDGQQQITILGFNDNQILDKRVVYLKNQIIIIKSRLNNFLDLELIICTVASLRELGVRDIELYVPYFLGSRSDRKFEEGSNNYLKTVICPIINSLGFAKVTVLDPHSDVLEVCLNNFNKIDNSQLVKYFFKSLPEGYNTNTLLISPDAGASKKIYKLADELEYTGNIITCSKFRNYNGSLSNTHVPISSRDLGKHFVIIDDICDGGATFINIAKEIHKWSKNVRISLIITHGIFSKGFEELNRYFDGIYCTNSYSDIPDAYTDGTKRHKTNVKQLNIF